MMQGSEEWLSWRRKGIGGSDIAAVLGICKFQTAYEVWLQKTGRAQPRPGTWATERGKELEGKARARFELLSMEDMPPAEIAHPKWPVCRVSLDGISDDQKRILEIKCPGEETHNYAVNGTVPDHYYPQVQYQLAVSGADVCYYFSFLDKTQSHAMVEVLPDLRYQGEIFSKALDFWKNHVEADVPPPLTAEDTLIVDTPEMHEFAKMLIDKNESASKAIMDQLKASFLKVGGHTKVKCGPVQVSTVLKNGKFSYHRLTIAREAQ